MTMTNTDARPAAHNVNDSTNIAQQPAPGGFDGGQLLSDRSSTQLVNSMKGSNENIHLAGVQIIDDDEDIYSTESSRDNKNSNQTDTYDKNGRLTETLIRDENGESERYTYDEDGTKHYSHRTAEGRLTADSTTRPDGSGEFRQYGESGSRIERIWDKDNNSKSNFFDKNGRLTGSHIRSRHGAASDYTYDEDGTVHSWHREANGRFTDEPVTDPSRDQSSAPELGPNAPREIPTKDALEAPKKNRSEEFKKELDGMGLSPEANDFAHDLIDAFGKGPDLKKMVDAISEVVKEHSKDPASMKEGVDAFCKLLEKYGIKEPMHVTDEGALVFGGGSITIEPDGKVVVKPVEKKAGNNKAAIAA